VKNKLGSPLRFSRWHTFWKEAEGYPHDKFRRSLIGALEDSLDDLFRRQIMGSLLYSSREPLLFSLTEKTKEALDEK